MALDKVLKIYDSEGNEVDYDIRANDVKLQDGESLPDKLAEMEKEIEDAGGYEPPAGGIPKTDLAQGVQDSLDLADSAVQPGDLATVATTGDYNDLLNKPTTTQELSILFIGNSLTQDAVSYLPLVLKELVPGLNFKFYVWYDGGYTLTQILDEWNNSGTADIFSVCENVTSWTNYNATKKIGDILSAYTFDVVCLEEYFNYMRGTGYTAAAKQSFNDIIAYLRSHYNKPFKVISFFHRPLCKNSSNQPDLAIADEVFGLTYDGVRWQLEETISEGVIPTGIAAYRAMYDNTLNSLGDFGYMSYDGTHSQEGLPCLMQAWCCALWILDKLGIETSINNAQTRVTSSNYDAINVPGPNGTVVEGTATQDKEAMDVAIKAFKEGKRLEAECISPFGIPAYKVAISGGSGTQTERNVQLGVSILPADASQQDVNWSIISGDAVVSSNGLVTYNGVSLNASVVVRAQIDGINMADEVTLTFALLSVETPVFSPVAGTYNAAQSVAISCATAGATIYYTTDGTTPTSASSVYSSPITVNADMTIKAIAVLNGDTSNVATAAYVINIPNTVTINVSDGVDPITDAVVLMTKDGTDHTPDSSSGGSYVFSLLDGTYTLTVSKSGYDTHTESVVVNGSDITKSVTLNVTTTVDMLAHAEFFNNWNTYMATGQYCAVEVSGRGAILVPNTYINTPITWHGGYPKTGYSPVEIPSGVHSVDIMFTNPTYKLYIYVCKQTGNSGTGLFSYSLKAGEPFRLVMANYSTAEHIEISVRRMDNDDANWQNTSIADLGLTCVANLVAPSDITYDMTPNLTLLNGIVTSNNAIDANTQRASLVAEKATNAKFQAYASGDRLSQEGATYAKPTIPFGTKQAVITMTNTEYKVAWFRLLEQIYQSAQTDVDTNAQLAWSVGQATPYTVNLPFTDRKSFYFQCNISKSGEDVNTTIADLGLKIEFVL